VKITSDIRDVFCLAGIFFLSDDGFAPREQYCQSENAI